MPPVPSTMLALGTAAPDFRLRDVVSGRSITRDEYRGAPALLVMFICNHCPFVKHVRHELARLAREYRERGVGIVAINANDAERYPQDGPAAMKEEAATRRYDFPYLFDETQDVARAYHAACTPDFFVFDADRRLAYRGQLDGSRPGNEIPVTGSDLRRALDRVIAGEPVPADEQVPSIGCGIKWKPGGEAGY